MHSDEPPQRGSRDATRRRRAAAAGRQPGVVVDVTSDVPRLALSRTRAAALARFVLRAERVPAAHVTIAFVTASRIAALHRRLMGRRGVTDIVTLEHERAAPGAPLVGEVWIAATVAGRNAATLGIPAREELARLVIHGTLHALGRDHPEDAGRTASPMWRRQEALLARARRAGMLSR